MCTHTHTHAHASMHRLQKTLMLGKIEGKRKKGTTEDEMVR